MAWIADAELASAVSNAGALGVIAAGYAPGEWIREEIRKTRKLTEKPFGLNIMLLNPNADEIARIAVDEGVKVVITGAGNPGKYVEMWKENNILVFPVIPSVALAMRMERAGADAVIAEGGEAGGHVGELTTMTLIPQVADAINIPVLAAGGIADGRGLAAAWMLGASGVQIGTRFLVAYECNVHKNYKQKILDAKDTSTIVTGRSTGHPVRIIKNRLARDFQALEKRNASLEEYEELGKGSLYRSAREGDMDYGSIMAGQSAGLVKKEQTCKEIIEEIFSEAKKIIEEKSKLI
ncbi:MAG: 2-nitropropane dioxygenase [Actinobacteria bacterium RBG_13_35_12]|uniref:2-nitropropane dioxygenase n=1 Tax=Candidatus Sediminicultor quintus TaxID=1797291 RepID=A0A1F5A683_9BACT|nr:MAG: 2-nitropropane dioxygenase [Actinobacteria bacterium RBG_13_35_12]OGD14090.1 MAG: 2-nitropropane dioxygenase [Candidatus Atribacteria bacterium RBG_19FT_COMBO_35_14]